MCVSSWRGVWAGVIIALAVSGARAEPLGPAWLASAEAARQQSLATGKPILIYFYGERCPACKVMQRDVLGRADVLEALRAQYVLMQANADQVPALAKQYGIVALPTTVAIAADGQPLDKIQGRLDAANYVARLNQTAANARRVPAGAGPQVAAAPASSPAGLPRMGDYTPPMPGGYAPAPNAGPGNSPAMVGPLANYAPPAAPSTVQSAAIGGYHPAAPAVPPATTTQPQVYTASQGVQAIPQPSQQWPVAPGAVPATQAPVTTPAAMAPPPMGDRTYQPAPGAPLSAGTQPQPAVPVAPHLPSPGTGAAPSYAPPTPNPQQAPPSAPAATQQAGAIGNPSAAVNPPLALEGFCAVELCERQRWTPGDPRFGLVHRGRTYLFAGAEQRDRFNADPDRYAPILSGTDIVLAIEQGRQLDGLRRHGVFYNGRVYLFWSEESLQRFAQRPDFYADQALQAMRAGAVPVYYR